MRHLSVVSDGTLLRFSPTSSAGLTYLKVKQPVQYQHVPWQVNCPDVFLSNDRNGAEA